MNYISSEVAGWALLIVGVVYLFKYKLFREQLDKIAAILTIRSVVFNSIARTVINLITKAGRRPLMTDPTTITTKLDELEQLCEKYPSKIPIEECAAFLGMAGESLRACLEHGSCPFGLGWLKKNAHNRAFYIPTLTFYLWVTQSAGFREGVRV